MSLKYKNDALVLEVTALRKEVKQLWEEVKKVKMRMISMNRSNGKWSKNWEYACRFLPDRLIQCYRGRGHIKALSQSKLCNCISVLLPVKHTSPLLFMDILFIYCCCCFFTLRTENVKKKRAETEKEASVIIASAQSRVIAEDDHDVSMRHLTEDYGMGTTTIYDLKKQT